MSGRVVVAREASSLPRSPGIHAGEVHHRKDRAPDGDAIVASLSTRAYTLAGALLAESLTAPALVEKLYHATRSSTPPDEKRAVEIAALAIVLAVKVR